MPNEQHQEQFLQLLEPVEKSLSHFCRAMTRNPETARDLMSETILVAFEKFGTLKDEVAFKSFLFTIARRLHRRARWRKRFFGEFDDVAAHEIHDSNSSPEVSTDAAILYEALELLPFKTREAVILFEISDLSLEQIRDIQGGTLSGVKSRVARGRDQLARILKTDVEIYHRSNFTNPDLFLKTGIIHSNQS
ncbi:MAG TPA: RNA polymerase sigma factor [Patescibacteria group bacterium]|nr:RNA polymerase sigma factor [Patescibacteria group bacterium]